MKIFFSIIISIVLIIVLIKITLLLGKGKIKCYFLFEMYSKDEDYITKITKEKIVNEKDLQFQKDGIDLDITKPDINLFFNDLNNKVIWYIVKRPSFSLIKNDKIVVKDSSTNLNYLAEVLEVNSFSETVKFSLKTKDGKDIVVEKKSYSSCIIGKVIFVGKEEKVCHQ